jgi:NAD(P)H-hydrate epimerase
MIVLPLDYNSMVRYAVPDVREFANMLVLTREQVRELDRRAVAELGIPSIVLMENAGRSAADCLCQLGISGPVVICCGKGNNAGDGFVIARHLQLRGHPVRVLLFSDPDKLSGDAAINFQIVQKCGIAWEQIELPGESQRLKKSLSGATWLVDALLGTGSTGEPRPPLDNVIDAMNARGVPIFAVDLPSGLDCNTGHASAHTIRATHTCTFVAAKPGLIVPSAQPFVGQCHIADIGVPDLLNDGPDK